jgi:hypothetical protein
MTMPQKHRVFLVLFVAISLGTDSQADENQLRASFDSNGVSVSEGDRPVLFYQRAVKSLDGGWPRANYVHPLYDLRGNVMTEDFPKDHGHHRGVFWAWHQVWLGDKKLGDPWVCKDFVWDVKSVEVTSPAPRLTIAVSVDWKSPDHVDASENMIPVVHESTEITVHAATSYRMIDFQISLQAFLEGVRIGGSEDDKGYGGFSPRIKLSEDQRFLSSAGEVEPTKLAIDAGAWINIAGKENGMVMIAHRSNPKTDASEGWILRRKRSMQNPVYPGRDPVELSTERATVLRYRLVIHDGNLSSEEISSIQQDYWGSD